MRWLEVCALVLLIPICALAQPKAGTVPPTSATTAQRPPAPSNTQAPDTAQTAASLLKSNGGSLLRASLAAQPDASFAKASQVSFFAVPPPEPHVLKKRDLVTIIVREESETSVDATSETKRKSDLDAKVDQFIKLNFAEGMIENAIGGDPPQIKASGTRNFKGEATLDRTDSMTMRVQAEVVDVKPNGTLVLQARATVTTDEEIQSIVLSGNCRAEDVTQDNTVLSTQLYDKTITKSHKGAARDATKRGLIQRLLDVVNPF